MAVMSDDGKPVWRGAKSEGIALVQVDGLDNRPHWEYADFAGTITNETLPLIEAISLEHAKGTCDPLRCPRCLMPDPLVMSSGPERVEVIWRPTQPIPGVSGADTGTPAFVRTGRGAKR